MNESVFSNQKSARQLIQSQNNEPIQFIRSPKTNKLFFSCGSITGYVSKSLANVLDTVDVDDVSYADVSTEDGVIPCLFVKSSDNVVRTLR